MALEIEPPFTRADRHRRYPPMIGIATPVKDDLADALRFGALGDDTPNRAGERDLVVGFDAGDATDRSAILAIRRRVALDFAQIGFRASMPPPACARSHRR